ncbi:MAG: PAS domain S-box protein [Candidatus Hydrogenedentes bacterium]|nr:PAS domain S-box protein [Candidatus Hydrogenedentota bacterium]
MMIGKVSQFLFGTLRGRLIIGVAAVHAVMMSVFVADLTARQRGMLQDRQVEQATALSQALAMSAAGWIAADDISGLQELVAAQLRYPENLFAILADRQGRVMADTDESRQGLYLLDLPRDAQQTVIVNTPALVDVATPAMIGGRHVGWARVGVGQKVAGERLAQIVRSGVFYAVAAILVGSVIAWFMGLRITRRLYAVQETIEAVRSGNRQARSLITGSDEAAVMSREFNSMLDALDERNAELHASEDRYRSLIQKVQTAIVLHDGQGRVLDSNLLAQDLLGLSADQLLGKPLIDPDWHFLQEDGSILPVARYPVSLVLSTRLPLRDYVTGISRRDRTEASWVLVNAEPEYDDAGEIGLVIVSFVDVTERKRAVETIRQLNADLAATLHAIPDLLFELDQDGAYLGVWAQNPNLLARQRELMLGHTVAEVLAPEVAETTMASIREADETGSSYGKVIRIDFSDGAKWFELSVSKKAGPNERGARFIVLSRDITKRKHAEESVRLMSVELQTIYDNTYTLFAYLDRDLNFIRVNRAYAEADQRDPDFFTGKNHFELYPHAENEAIFRGVVETGQPYFAHAKPFVYPNHPELGVTYWDWTLVPVFSAEKTVTGLIFTLLDVTDRERAEEALRESEHKYRLLVANASEAIFVVQNETVKFPNTKTLELTGYSAEELAEMSFADLVHPNERDMVVERYMQRSGDMSSSKAHRFRILDKQGRQIWTQLTAAGISWEEKPGTLCFLRDITEEKKLEAQFLQAQKMEALGQLAGGVAHDFNNLLQVILGYVEVLQGDLDKNTEAGEALEEVRQSAERAADLTRQLLAFSRRQVIQAVNVDLNELIQGVLKMIRRVIGEHIELCYMPGDRLGSVHADKGQFAQVLMNLCVNARDAMPSGGTLTIETENVVIGDEYCREHPWAVEGRYVLLSVTDTGVGMDEATRAQIFDPFFTTKGVGEGTGLGLATVYGIVKQHNGLIHVYSELEKGTTFKIYMPISERRAEVVETKIELRAVGGTETILVAEDEAAVRNLVSHMLTTAGYTVLTARDGEDALRVFEEHADSIDLALLDVMMPKLGGRSVMDRIQAKRPEIRILFSSGYTQHALDTSFVVKEGLRLITKPYRRADLLRAIRDILDAP